MKKLIKLLIGLFLILAIIIMAGYIGILVTRESDPVASRKTEARGADGRYISWVEHRIDDQEKAGGLRLRGADGLEAADLDGDGHLDIVSVHEDSNHIRLAFGTGDPDQWELITLAGGDFVEGVEDPAIGDVNGDKSPDLLFACEGGSIVYFQNPGIESGAAVRDPKQWKFCLPKVAMGKDSWIRVYLADLNGDGKPEATATNKSIKMHGGFGSMDVPPSPVSWFNIPDNPLDDKAWVENQLGKFLVPVNSRPVDLDGDGDPDILAGSRGESRMVIFENENADPPRFKKRPINVANRSVPEKPRLPKKLSGMVLAFADLNKDGRLDIITFETPWSIVWLEQPGNWDQPWTIHPIGAVFPDSPTALTLYDINGDGRLDLFTGGYSQDPRNHDLPEPGVLYRAGGIFWFEQPEELSAPWKRHYVSRRMRGMFDAFIPLDLNGDGLIDFVGTRGNSGEYDGLIWLEQKRTETPEKSFFQARPKESRQLPPPPGLLRYLSDKLLSRKTR